MGLEVNASCHAAILLPPTTIPFHAPAILLYFAEAGRRRELTDCAPACIVRHTTHPIVQRSEATTVATQSSTRTASIAVKLLFGGYALVAMVTAWLTGVAVYRAAPLAPALWLAGAACCALLWLATGLTGRMLPALGVRGWLRLLLAAGMLGLWLCLGGARRLGRPDPRLERYLASGAG
jgi:hypothetical protein